MTAAAGSRPGPKPRSNAERKSERFTVVTTKAVAEQLARAAALAGLSRSEMAHDCLVRGLDGLPGVDDATIEAAEEAQDEFLDWRRSRGLA